MFIHDALLEAIECGVTEVAARDLPDRYKMLGTMDSRLVKTEIQIEFEKLESTIHYHPTQMVGTLPANKHKNRYARLEMITC